MQDLLKRERYVYIREKLLQTWFAYIMLVGFFMLAIDGIRGSSRTLIFYVSVISSTSLIMALVELFFYRKVIKVPSDQLPEILQVIKALSFEKAKDDDNNRLYFVMKGRKYFMRSLDMTILPHDSFLYLNLNVFHLRYFRRFIQS